VKRTSIFWLIPALLLVASCGDDAGGTPPGDDGGNLPPDGSVDRCGNGVAEGDELCDGIDLNGETCNSATHGVMIGGRLSCRVDCTFNVAECTGEDSGMEDEDGGLGGTGG
jgi:hypothetical protein